jgi:hypothetical protein
VHLAFVHLAFVHPAFVHPAFVHPAFVHPASVPLCSSVTSVSSVSAARQGPKQMAVR